MKAFVGALVFAMSSFLLPVGAMAQSTGTISGVVRDSSGSVLPGVTVEAASPALIEKVRSVITDGQGVYRIIDLRPGNYSVTFSLPGFATVRREGIELTTGFTAVINTTLAVGAVQETITVSGAAPLVDTQNVTDQRVYSRDVTEALPLGSSVAAYTTLLPGVSSSYNVGDVGGSTSELQSNYFIHGGRQNDFQQLRDGMFFGTLIAAGNWMTSINPASVAESNIQIGNAGAELESAGILINIVPRDGGNVFSGTFNLSGTSSDFQSENVDEALKARGVLGSPKVRKRYDVGGGFGGPILRDKLWFFGSARTWKTSTFYDPGNFYNKIPTTLFYEPDLSRPVFEESYYNELRVRSTWQATAKDKIVGMFGYEPNCNCPGRAFVFQAPETVQSYKYKPNWQATARWTRPITNRLLLEAGVVAVNVDWHTIENAPAGAKQSVFDVLRGYLYGGTYYGRIQSHWQRHSGQSNEKFTMSYVTGSHSFKAGMTHMYGYEKASYTADPSVANMTDYVFAGAFPLQVIYDALPLANDSRQRTIGLFAQDQWTIDRLTMNLGIRYDYLKGWANAIDLPAGVWVPARSFPAATNIPNWKDWNPRFGAAYDLFGNGRTAVKASLGRYILFEGMAGFIASNAPSNLTVEQANRGWFDANHDYVPQESELGPLSDANFGKLVPQTRYADDVLLDNRSYNWQASVQLQQELWRGAAVNVGYFRRWYGNFQVTQNTAVTANDFNRYCVTAPSNPGLPGGGGQSICGFYDVVPGKFGQVSNVVTQASNFGKQSEVFNGVDVSLTSRFGSGGFVQFGMATGVTETDNCYLNNLPNVQLPAPPNFAPGRATTARNDDYCKVSPPWGPSTQYKAAVIYPLLWGLQASANYQNVGGASTSAEVTILNAAIAPSLGRDLSGGVTSAQVNVVLPQTYYQEPRAQQLDLKVSRRFTFSRGVRIEPKIELFNITNENSVLAQVPTLGPLWRNVTSFREPRLIRFGVDLNF